MKFQADILIQSDASRCTAYVNSSETVLPGAGIPVAEPILPKSG